MKKLFVVMIGICFFLNSCTTHKVYSKLIETENKKVYLNPLIVIPFTSITEFSSKKIKEKLITALYNKNLNATIHLLEVKQGGELKLNEKETNLYDEISPIYDKNKNDVIIFFRYDQYNYGGYGTSFSQHIMMFEKDTEKIVWKAGGFTTYDGIDKYCAEIVDKLLLDKIISY